MFEVPDQATELCAQFCVCVWTLQGAGSTVCHQHLRGSAGRVGVLPAWVFLTQERWHVSGDAICSIAHR